MRSRRSARLSAARLQSADAGSDLETKRNALDARLPILVDYSSSKQQSIGRRAGLGCFFVSICKTPRQVYSRAHSARLFAAKPEAASVGSYARCRALGASLRGVRPHQQRLISPFARISPRKQKTICFSHRMMFRFFSYS